jgi:hypothetical protein
MYIHARIHIFSHFLVILSSPVIDDCFCTDNQITDHGANALAIALTKNVSLVHLDVRVNEIGSDGSEQLLEIAHTEASGVDILVNDEISAFLSRIYACWLSPLGDYQ